MPIALSALVCACVPYSPYYGLVRKAELDATPSPQCIKSVLSSTPGVRLVETTKFDQMNIVRPPYIFLYHGPETKEVPSSVVISQDNAGVISYVHSTGKFGIKVAQAQIDAIHPTMLVIEKRLISECGLISLPAKVNEICSGVTCTSSGSSPGASTP